MKVESCEFKRLVGYFRWCLSGKMFQAESGHYGIRQVPNCRKSIPGSEVTQTIGGQLKRSGCKVPKIERKRCPKASGWRRIQGKENYGKESRFWMPLKNLNQGNDIFLQDYFGWRLSFPLLCILYSFSYHLYVGDAQKNINQLLYTFRNSSINPFSLLLNNVLKMQIWSWCNPTQRLSIALFFP